MTPNRTVLTAGFLLLPALGGCALIGAPARDRGAGAATVACTTNATYEAALAIVWSAETHPKDFPSGAHFSPPVAASHRPGSGFWSPGELASPGVEVMAESGATGALVSEIAYLASRGLASEAATGSGFGAPGSGRVTVTATQAHPAVSLVTMVAPSPDWFVGVADVNLCVGEDWLDSLTVELTPYDAGTDDGPTYRAPNADTAPPLPIHALAESADAGQRAYGEPAYGTLNLTRIE